MDDRDWKIVATRDGEPGYRDYGTAAVVTTGDLVLAERIATVLTDEGLNVGLWRRDGERLRLMRYPNRPSGSSSQT